MGWIDAEIEATRTPFFWLSRTSRMPSLMKSTYKPENGESTSATRTPFWISRTSRMQSLKKSTYKPENGESTSASSSSSRLTVSMDLELYLASKSTDADDVIRALERVCAEKKLPLSNILDQVSPTGNSLLHLCVIHGNLDGAALIAHSFPTLVARPNSKGDTALHLAARAGNSEIVKTLVAICRHYLNEEFDDTSADDWCDSLLMLRNKEGNMPLHEALIRMPKLARLLIGNNTTGSHFVNDKGESPLYLAAKAGETELVKTFLLSPFNNEFADGGLIGKSAAHAAVLHRQLDVLKILMDGEPRFILSRDEEGMTPLHLATSLGYLEAVIYLLNIKSDCVFEMDNNGLLPIHLASTKGHINLVEKLLQYWPDPCELLTSNGQTILHIAVKSGGHDMVSYILRKTNLSEHINMRDKDGNTPLHVAAMSWHPRIVSTLTWDKRVNLKIVNIEGKTALDCAENCMDKIPSFRMRLTWAALKSGGVPRAYSNSTLKIKDLKHSTKLDQSSMESYKDRVNTLLLVATLVATVTFAAGFTMPGGYNNSDPDQGMATMLENRWFHLFVFCDTIAMYNSIIVSVVLILAQLGDINLVLTALRWALPLLGVALSMMSLSFVAGVYLVVSKLRWLAISLLVLGFVLLTILATLFFFLSFPISSNYRILRCISYYPFCLLVFVSKNYN